MHFCNTRKLGNRLRNAYKINQISIFFIKHFLTNLSYTIGFLSTSSVTIVLKGNFVISDF